MNNNKINLAIFASHGGSNAQALIDACKADYFPAKVSFVLTNNSNANVINRAKESNIPVIILNKTHVAEPLEEFCVNALKQHKVDLILLAGYMKKIPSILIKEFENRILNIHPALLPKFGGKGMFGMNVHKAVIESKEEFSGASIHLVTENYDEGPILAQEKVKILERDTAESLQKKVLAVEHQLYKDTVKKYITENF
ncbi:UNVERIFIED_CONTAM: hypothetical protein GTU68_050907 [Idotea baltica]|nr:hypothetical protein [Idotea baltica]